MQTHTHIENGFDPEVFAMGIGVCNDQLWLLMSRKGIWLFRLQGQLLLVSSSMKIY